jgi:4-hydroxy-tetrahydrodipicolinate reductase
MPTKIAISGVSGRMGKTLVALIAEHPEFELVAGFDEDQQPTDAAVSRAEVIIDFSAVPALQALLEQHGDALRGRALVVGTTGLTEAVQRLLDQAAQHAAVLTAANFSVGVNLLLSLVEHAARVLPAEQFDVEIVEAHHRRKADAPSGTALALGQSITAGREQQLSEVRRDGRSGQTGARPAGEIGFHALRGGDIVGEHRVHFIGPHEHIEFAHSAQDRGLFAEGALLAARWIAGKPAGRYTMKDVLGLGA